jgi:hypothetical protein
MTTKHDFFLRKWYLDCVADNGDTCIGYAATLQWKAFKLHYSSITSTQGNAASTTKTSLGESSVPQIKDRQIEWVSKPLDLVGTWTASSEPIQQRLYESDEGIVTWSCLQPLSRVNVSFGTKTHLEGLGYAELLELTIKPWQLPITELRWGRYLSERDALVWIDWRGAVPLSMVFHNGKQIQDALIGDHHIVFDRGRTELSLTEPVELRKGILVSTALSSIPRVETVLPVRMLRTYECKWRSKGAMATDGSVKSTGWSIHEIVRFP